MSPEIDHAQVRGDRGGRPPVAVRADAPQRCLARLVGGCLMARASAHQRALAARSIRERKSYAQAAKIAGVSKWTVTQWMKDPGFLALVHGPGVITLGPATIVRAYETDVVDLPVEESWVWIDSASNAVIGSLLVQDAHQLRAEI